MEHYTAILPGEAVYDDAEFKKVFKLLDAAFPNLKVEFYSLLKQRIIYYKISLSSFEKAVNHVIDNSVFLPTIASILSQCDLKKAYSHTDLIMNNADFKQYKTIDLNGKLMYIKK